ncbi:MAG: YceD family protein [SAR324 cluster bacterium]
MHIPVSQISEDGWTAALDIPLASLRRVVATHGPQSGTLRAQVTLKNHKGCVDVRGRLVAELSLACGVCLDTGTVRVEAPLELMVAPQALWISGHREGQHEEVRLNSADLDVSFYEGDEIDLNAVLEDELLIAAPDSLEQQDEDGNCSFCGRSVQAILAERQAAREEDMEFHPFREAAELAERLREAQTRLGREAQTTPSAERIRRESLGSVAASNAERPGRALARGANGSVRGADDTVGPQPQREKRTLAARGKTAS